MPCSERPEKNHFITSTYSAPVEKKNVNIKAERKLSLLIVYLFPALIKTASKTG